MPPPRAIIIPAVKKHAATIIVVHGLGDSGAGWSWLAENWRRRGKFENVSFIFPNAPTIEITVNNGFAMPGWYDIISFNTLNRTDDEPGIMRSRSYLHSLVNDQLKAGIPAKRIILGGFSQGGAMSLFAGLTFPERLAGVFGLSCYQLMPSKFETLHAETGSHKPPVFMGHGTADPVVRFDWGKLTAEGLKKQGFNINWNEYPGVPHSVAPEEIDELEKWVQARLNDGEGESAAS